MRRQDPGVHPGVGGGVTEAVNEHLAPLRARRTELAADRGHVREVLRRGNERANAVAETTLAEVRAAMGTLY
ncbi:hypothetical protein [Streptomyces sp. NPDC058401]|uniref:hypothetical protein n=1 Tax=Streptomyces sp. NPDC058401 TaxID=3346480 RepID=UPI00364B5036